MVINSVKGIDGASQFSSLCEEIQVEEEMGKSVVTSLHWNGDPGLRNLIEVPFFDNEDLSSSKMTSLQNKHAGGVPRVKAIYGEEMIRFRLNPTWGVNELKHEINKRFNTRDVNSMDLKYLDENSEWVLLRSDEDLKECTTLFRTSRIKIIKVAVHLTVPSAEQSVQQ